MRNVSAANPAHTAALAEPLEWTLPHIDKVDWRTIRPDYTKRLARMSLWCGSWMDRMNRSK